MCAKGDYIAFHLDLMTVGRMAERTETFGALKVNMEKSHGGT